MTQKKEIPFGDIIKQSLIAAILSLIIFVPTMGIVLDTYSFDAKLIRPIIAAVIVFVGKFSIEIFRYRWQPPTNKTDIAQEKRPFSTNQKVLGMFLLGVCLTGLPFFFDKYWLGVFCLTLIYVLLGLGLNIVVGMAGLLDLGFVAFYAVGAYGYALLNLHFDLGFWTSLVCASSIAGICGAILGFPVLRLHGDYLAIVTLGFGEIINLVLTNWSEVTHGPDGISAPLPTLFGLEFKRRASQGGTAFHEFFNIEYMSEARYLFIYFCLLLVVGFVIFGVTRLKNMPIGRAWEALRENEIAAKALGINYVTVKLSAFSMGAFIGGVAGVFFAGFQGFIDPLSFTFIESALILAIVVLGGQGSTVGVILAAIFITVTPEFLREFSDYRILIFGIFMVIMMIWKPRGLIKSQRKQFNLNRETAS